MRSRKQTPPELNGDHVDDSADEPDSAAVDALALAEEAEAEAAEAEAVAAAARARAKALRLRREAEEAKAAETVAAPEPEDDTEQDDDADDEKKEEVADADGSEVTAVDSSERRRRGTQDVECHGASRRADTAAVVEGCRGRAVRPHHRRPARRFRLDVHGITRRRRPSNNEGPSSRLPPGSPS